MNETSFARIRLATACPGSPALWAGSFILLGGLLPGQKHLEKPKISQKCDFRGSATSAVDIFRPITSDMDVARLSENPQGWIKAKWSKSVLTFSANPCMLTHFRQTQADCGDLLFVYPDCGMALISIPIDRKRTQNPAYYLFLRACV